MTELLLYGDDPTSALSHVERPLSVDVETTGLLWDDRLLGVSLAWLETDNQLASCYLVPLLPGQQTPLFRPTTTAIDSDLLLAGLYRNRCILHNHSFDYRVLFRWLDCEPLPSVVDTMHLGKHLPATTGVSLLALYERFVKPVSTEYRQMKTRRAGLDQIDTETVAAYGREDAVKQYELYRALRILPGIGNGAYLRLHEWDNQLQWLVMSMVQRGLPVDKGWVYEKRLALNQAAFEAQTALIRKYGIGNANSPADVSSYLQAHGYTLDSADEEQLVHLVPDLPEMGLVLTVRQATKAVSSWLEPALALSELDGHLHSRLNPFGTRSFRMSSEDINVQGIPMEDRGRFFGSMVGLFKSQRDGFSLWALDLKQAEVRLAAILSLDPTLQEALQGEDPYTSLAQALWGDPKRRQQAKQAMLSAIYEVGKSTFAMRYGTTEQEAGSILDTFRNRFGILRRESRRLEAWVKRFGYVLIGCTDRPRYFTIKEVEQTAYKAFNQRVQGAVAEVMHDFMLRIEGAIPDRLVLQIHDSVVLYLPDDPDSRRSEMRVLTGLLHDTEAAMLPAAGRALHLAMDLKPFQLMSPEPHA